jgi:hypothetical protein
MQKTQSINRGKHMKAMARILVAALSGLVMLVMLPAINVQAEGTLPLSQTSANLSIGQNVLITAYPPYGQQINVTYISNAYVAYANVTGNLVTVYGLSNGTAQIELGTSDNYYATINVNVGSGGIIAVNPGNVSLNVGQTSSAAISGGYSTYSVLANSNPSVVSAWVSGDKLNVSALTAGSSTVKVYANNVNEYGTLYVTVVGVMGNLTFSQASFNLAVNEMSYVTIYSPVLTNFGDYYISTNTNPNVVSAGVNGTTVSLRALSPGNANLTVYQGSTGMQGTLYVTVRANQSGNIYANGTLINENGTIFITYKNTKTGFANSYAFTGLGYQFSTVTASSYQWLSNTGYVMNTPFVPHPWGSWVKSGNTVYFVHQDGLIPIPTHQIFTDNGGRDGMVVPMNSYDFTKPMLPLMVMSDARLR